MQHVGLRTDTSGSEQSDRLTWAWEERDCSKFLSLDFAPSFTGLQSPGWSPTGWFSPECCLDKASVRPGGSRNGPGRGCQSPSGQEAELKTPEQIDTWWVGGKKNKVLAD